MRDPADERLRWSMGSEGASHPASDHRHRQLGSIGDDHAADCLGCRAGPAHLIRKGASRRPGLKSRAIFGGPDRARPEASSIRPWSVRIRSRLRAYTAAAIADTWPNEPHPPGRYPQGREIGATSGVESFTLGEYLAVIDRMIEELVPKDVFHQQTAERLRARVADVLQQRWRLIASTHSTISWPFLTVLLFWLVIIFAIFGLTSPRNVLVHVVIVLGALSVSSSVYLILEFDAPQAGLLRVPSQSLRDALSHMDRPEGPEPGDPRP